MKCSENRKITACATRDGDSLERKNLWALLCVLFFFYSSNIVQCGGNGCFSLNLLAQRVSSFKLALCLTVGETERHCESDFNYSFHLKTFFSPLRNLGLSHSSLQPTLCVKDRRLGLHLIKTFQFVACYGTKCSHHIIILTGNLLSLGSLFCMLHTINKISLWASVALPAKS